MKIKLESLQHQTDAINAINQSFKGIDLTQKNNDIYANPPLVNRYEDEANIDIKMETGTGKTYVYTRMMYELHKQGIFKFVIIVPTPSIKEGTAGFINSDYAKQHFNQFYGNTRIQLNVINSGDFGRVGRKKKNRLNFPAKLSEFIESTSLESNQIQVLLINAGMLNSISMSRDDYDSTLLNGITCPMEAIAATKPVVIIDEPHRFSKDKKTYATLESLKPQMIVRFGATFPEISQGSGKNKVTKTDYYRGEPQFTLNAIDSFNQGLIKGIDINYPDLSKDQAENLYKIKRATSKEMVLSKNGRELKVAAGESLVDVDSSFEGNVIYDGGVDKELSNGLSLKNFPKDMILIPGTFAKSYQEKIIKAAIDRHFATEIKNFMRPDNAPRIKTLSLYFIDSVDSYGRSVDGNGRNKGWLIKLFEKLLRAKISGLMDHYNHSENKREKEYYDFLKATNDSLNSEHQNVYAGYFSDDRGNSDADVQAEINDILSNKEKLLSFKDKQGNWITRRFLFSKWTLREGWDNPNVFVLAKLRTSGSEISKIQEVGRGLRLPVDETGHRLSQDEWESRLAFFIGYDEKDFAEKLVGEINEDAPVLLDHKVLTPEMLETVVKLRQKNDLEFDQNKLLASLDKYGIINRSNEFQDNVDFDGQKISGFQAFTKMYPEIIEKTKLGNDKVRNLNKNPRSTVVKLRKNNWQVLKELWKELSLRKMIVFNDNLIKESESLINKVLQKDSDNFVYQHSQFVENKLKIGQKATITETESDYQKNYVTMQYGEFLKQLGLRTDLSINLVNRTLVKQNPDLDLRYINELTLNNIVIDFNTQFNKLIKDEYRYESLEFSSSTSIYDKFKDDFVESIPASSLGVYEADATSEQRYLYDRPPLRYDSSDPELKILKRTYSSNITVFGKLPKRAIKIPRFDGGSTTPDFIFQIKNSNEKPIYLIVETKASNMRIGDEVIKSIQENYFNNLNDSGIYYQLATTEQEVYSKLDKLEVN